MQNKIRDRANNFIPSQLFSIFFPLNLDIICTGFIPLFSIRTNPFYSLRYSLTSAIIFTSFLHTNQPILLSTSLQSMLQPFSLSVFFLKPSSSPSSIIPFAFSSLFDFVPLYFTYSASPTLLCMGLPSSPAFFPFFFFFSLTLL